MVYAAYAYLVACAQWEVGRGTLIFNSIVRYVRPYFYFVY